MKNAYIVTITTEKQYPIMFRLTRKTLNYVLLFVIIIQKIYSTLFILYYKMLYRKYIKHKESIELNVSF